MDNPSDGESNERTVGSLIRYQWKKFVNTDAYRALLEILNATRTDETLRDRVSDNLHEWNRALDTQSLSTYRSSLGDDEDVRLLTTMTRSFLRGLVIQDRYADDPSENIKLVERWIELVEPHLQLKKP